MRTSTVLLAVAACASQPVARPTETLPKVGLKVSAPAGTTVSDAIVGEGHMVMGPGLVLTVNAATDASPETLDAAKEEADLFSPTNINEEILDDGWVLTYENTGGMGTNYFVTVRRTIGESHCTADLDFRNRASPVGQSLAGDFLLVPRSSTMEHARTSDLGRPAASCL